MVSKGRIWAETGLPLLGGTLAAVGAGLCCVGPFVLVMLGIGGAWVGNLTLLEPYRPILVATALLLFGWAGWRVHRPVNACVPGTACAVPKMRKRRQIIFWISALIALTLATSTYWIPLLI